MSEVKDDACGKDFVIAGPKVPGRAEHVGVRHRPDHTLEPVLVAPLVDGQPVSDETEIVSRVGDGVYEVQGRVGDLKKGPARVNSTGFRDGWDRVFGDRRKEMN